MTRREIAEFFRRLAAARPEPETELDFENGNPFTLLVAVVLSAQATDAGVNKATGPLFAIADTPEKMLALGEETIAVDTHIFRVANRTGLAPGKTPREVEDGLERRVPAPYRRHAHHWLILHGRYVCKARRPECPACIVSDLCRYRAKTTIIGSELAPPLPPG
jgi:endonuclease III